jgi:iron(III) transport system substrate-binding protein
MTKHHIRGRFTATVAATLALSALLAGGATTAAEPSTVPDTTVPDTTEPEPAGAGLEELVAAASEEGALTVYSDQAEGALNALADAFMERYPDIDVQVVRDIHPNIAPAAELELETGNGIADIYVSADALWFSQQGEAGSFQPLQGPELLGEGDYDAAQFVKPGNYFEVGGAVNVYAWNTSEWPDGLTGDYTELLDERLAGGRIGIVDPTVAVYVDWYLWLEDRMGDDFLESLAAQSPRVYQGAAPINEALVSGEISVTPYAFPPIIIPSQDAGAPVEFGLLEDEFWGAPHHAGVLNSAPHPNAAFLYANFMLTPDGQAIINALQSSVTEGTGIAFNGDMVEAHDITPEDVTAFQERFRDLFLN